MRQKIIYLLITFGIVFVACQQEKSLSEYMVNTWETTYLKIKMPTFQNSDSTSVFEDTFENNPPRRAQSSYKSDGTFIAWFLDRENKRQADAPGKWKMKGDSLYIEYFYGGRDVKVAYHIQKTEEGFIGVSKYDWDEDGEFDDLLTMKTKQIHAEE